MFHVSSAANRESILAHGLDWMLMGAALGIAGSTAPEAEGVFLCRDEFEVGFFTAMNNTGGPVDVWLVTGIEEDELTISDTGFSYFPARIPRAQVALADDWPRDERRASAASAGARERRRSKQRKKKPRAGSEYRLRTPCWPRSLPLPLRLPPTMRLSAVSYELPGRLHDREGFSSNKLKSLRDHENLSRKWRRWRTTSRSPA